MEVQILKACNGTCEKLLVLEKEQTKVKLCYHLLTTTVILSSVLVRKRQIKKAPYLKTLFLYVVYIHIYQTTPRVLQETTSARPSTGFQLATVPLNIYEVLIDIFRWF